MNDKDQILFYYPSDQNWWLGTFQEEPGLIRWQSVGNTRGFGNATGHMFWSGRFTGDGLNHMIAYNPDNQNWQLGTYVMGRLQWIAAGNTSGFGNLLVGQMFWTGRFSQDRREEVLFYNPSDQNWFLGSHTLTLKWTPAGNTSNFGNLLAGQMFWTGRFSQDRREEVLFYNPSDQNWWLGSYDSSTAALKWTLAGNTSNFGNLLAGHRFWIGSFSAAIVRKFSFIIPAIRIGG